MGGLRKVLIYKYATFSHVTVFEHACFTGHHTWYEPPVSPQILCSQGAVSYLGVFFTECTRAPPHSGAGVVRRRGTVGSMGSRDQPSSYTSGRGPFILYKVHAVMHR